MPDERPHAADGLPIDAEAESSRVASATAARAAEPDGSAPDDGRDADGAEPVSALDSERLEVSTTGEDGAPDTDIDAIERLTDALGALDERLAESQRLLAHQTELADRLHAENQRLRAGELRAAQLPLVRDLMRMHDDIGRLVAASTEEADTDLTIMRASLLDALARNGVETFEPTVGDTFDPHTHTARGVVATADPALDRCVAAVVRAGFMWEDKALIRAADVRVHRLEQSNGDSADGRTTEHGQ